MYTIPASINNPTCYILDVNKMENYDFVNPPPTEYMYHSVVDITEQNFLRYDLSQSGFLNVSYPICAPPVHSLRS